MSVLYCFIGFTMGLLMGFCKVLQNWCVKIMLIRAISGRLARALTMLRFSNNFQTWHGPHEHERTNLQQLRALCLFLPAKFELTVRKVLRAPGRGPPGRKGTDHTFQPIPAHRFLSLLQANPHEDHARLQGLPGWLTQ